MLAFINGLQKGSYMRHKFQCDKNACILTLNDMIHYASNCAAADDDAGGTMPAMLPSHKKNNNNNGKRKNPSADQQTAGSDNMVAMTFQRGSQGGSRGRGRSSGAGRGQKHAESAQATGTRTPQSYEEYRDMPCVAHIDPATGKSTHTNRHCRWVNDLKSDPEAGYKRARKPRTRDKGGKGKKDPEAAGEDMEEDDATPEAEQGTAAKSGNPWAKKTGGAYHTFLSTPTVRQKKS